MSRVTPTDGRARRYTRLGLTLLGVLGAGLFSRATQRANHQLGIVPGLEIDDGWILFLGIAAGILVLGGLPVLYVVRRRRGSCPTA